MSDPVLDDVRSTDPVERLLEDSWEGRSRLVSRRERAVEAFAAVLFLCCAVPLALAALASHTVDPLLAAVLVCLYALVSRVVRFPIGAGYVVPSYLVLVPILLLLPPGLAPLLTAAGLLLGTLGQVAARRTTSDRVLSAIPDAWHVLGPAAVLLAAGPLHGGTQTALVYIAAFVAGCLFDLVSSAIREAAILGVGSHVQLQVAAVVWLVDMCVAPLGLLVAHAARRSPADVLLIVPINVVLLLLSRDRNARIAQAQSRLDLLARERTRLQRAVGRLGEVLAAKLDLDALTDIVLRGSIYALDADAGRFTLSGPLQEQLIEIAGTPPVAPALAAAAEQADACGEACHLQRDGIWALALPFRFSSEAGQMRGAVAVARAERAFREDEQAVMSGLVERARQAASDIFAHQLLQQQAMTDSLTKLGNRRKLAADVEERLADASAAHPLALIMFDLDGFKGYNDAYGHLAGDALLARLGARLASAVSDHGSAYRFGGDEFCALLAAPSELLNDLLAAAASALQEPGENFVVGASYGAVLLPHEATNLDYAMQLADERMYARKHGRVSSVADQARDALVRVIDAMCPSVHVHSNSVAALCRRVGRRLSMSDEELDVLVRAAELHDIGKVGIRTAALERQDERSGLEEDGMRENTVLAERILSAVPALCHVARLVRSSSERWDGCGYPDGLLRGEIPLGSRVMAVCDAYESMTSGRGGGTPREHVAACEQLRRGAGRRYDPRVVGMLLAELRERSEPDALSRASGAGGSAPPDIAAATPGLVPTGA